MASERRYYDDAYTRAFTADVAQTGTWKDAPAVELETTWFYPESGGQRPDRGMVGESRVLDVQADDDGRVWHVVDSPPAARTLACAIDWPRRFDHMQQHTGQHVLSAALLRVLDAPTLSSTLGEERCVIEIGLDAIDWATIGQVERAANAVLWEDREIRLHWTDDRGIANFPLRKPPKVTGRIRVVEIDDWDWSACGGTHTRRTGEVGVLKVVHWEKVRGNVRLSFHCGARALADHAWRAEAMVEAARRRSAGDRELLEHLERGLDERDALRKRLAALEERLLDDEARTAVAAAPGGVAVIADARERDHVRQFALRALTHGAPWAVSAARGPAPSIVIGRAKANTALDLRTFVPELLAVAHGRGGGSAELVTIAPADAAAADAAFALARARLATGTPAS